MRSVLDVSGDKLSVWPDGGGRKQARCVCTHWRDLYTENAISQVFEFPQYKSGTTVPIGWTKVSYGADCVKLVINIRRVRSFQVCIPCGGFRWGSATFTPEVRCKEVLVATLPSMTTGPSEEIESTHDKASPVEGTQTGSTKPSVLGSRERDFQDSQAGQPTVPQPGSPPANRIYVQATVVVPTIPEYSGSGGSVYKKGEVTAGGEIYAGDVLDAYKFAAENGYTLVPVYTNQQPWSPIAQGPDGSAQTKWGYDTKTGVVVETYDLKPAVSSSSASDGTSSDGDSDASASSSSSTPTTVSSSGTGVNTGNPATDAQTQALIDYYKGMGGGGD